MRRLTPEKPNAPAPNGTALLLYTYVAGVKYYDFADGDLPIDEGMTVELRREPDNSHDRLAVEVLTPEGIKLGYLPRASNTAPARLMDAGWELFARLESIQTGREDTGRRTERRHRSWLELSVFVPCGSNLAEISR